MPPLRHPRDLDHRPAPGRRPERPGSAPWSRAVTHPAPCGQRPSAADGGETHPLRSRASAGSVTDAEIICQWYFGFHLLQRGRHGYSEGVMGISCHLRGHDPVSSASLGDSSPLFRNRLDLRPPTGLNRLMVVRRERAGRCAPSAWCGPACVGSVGSTPRGDEHHRRLRSPITLSVGSVVPNGRSLPQGAGPGATDTPSVAGLPGRRRRPYRTRATREASPLEKRDPRR